MRAGGDIAGRLDQIRERIDAACVAAGRNAAAVRIVAVTKKLAAEPILAAYAAGQRDFGENYVQEGVPKIASLRASMPDARWHFIGRLQSNKAAQAAKSFALLHGIDSPGTVAALARVAGREGRTIDVLLQVRLGNAGQVQVSANADRPRGGVEMEDARSFLDAAAANSGVRFVGLMGVADPDLPARPQFAALRKLAEDLAAVPGEHAPLGELSMGMTGDFEDAVAEGSTIVRIGTAIFGQRPAG